MSTHRSVAYALIAPVLDDLPEVEGETLEGHVVFENDLYEPVEGQPHVKCHWRPGALEASMDGRTSWERGTMRFELCGPLRGGATYLNALADEMMSKFPISTRFTHSDWVVTVIGLVRSAATRTGAWRRVFVDCVYHSHNVAA